MGWNSEFVMKSSIHSYMYLIQRLQRNPKKNRTVVIWSLRGSWAISRIVYIWLCHTTFFNAFSQFLHSRLSLFQLIWAHDACQLWFFPCCYRSCLIWSVVLFKVRLSDVLICVSFCLFCRCQGMKFLFILLLFRVCFAIVLLSYFFGFVGCLCCKK